MSEDKTPNKLASILERLDETLRLTTSVNLVAHFNNRYTGMVGKRKEEFVSKISWSKDGIDMWVDIREQMLYWNSYWQLQYEQYIWFKHDAIAEWMFVDWINWRHRDYNIATLVEQEQSRKAKPTDSQKIKHDRAKELREAHREQEMYRKGWHLVTNMKLLSNTQFVEEIDAVMKYGGSHIHNMVQSILSSASVDSVINVVERGYEED